MFDSPFADIIKVFALVFGVEIRERRRALPIEPDLAENTGVSVTHESLTDRVQTVRCNEESVFLVNLKC